MQKIKTKLRIRKVHRYLGLFLGIQFLLWTISGLYFSWTNIDEIHGDHFRKKTIPKVHFPALLTDSISMDKSIYALSLKEIGNEPYYWVNDSILIHARTGEPKSGISKEEALAVAKKNIKDEFKVTNIEVITKTNGHHEYRSRPLPAYAISYDTPGNMIAYISMKNGDFQRVRHRSWRWFDFLWMTHIMDYQERDNINNLLLRGFSILGLLTVFSGFLLWFTSSPTIRKFYKK